MKPMSPDLTWNIYICLYITILVHKLWLSNLENDGDSCMFQSYLLKYGYLGASDGRSGSLITEDYRKHAVSEFQRFAGLPVTGETLHLFLCEQL